MNEIHLIPMDSFNCKICGTSMGELINHSQPISLELTINGKKQIIKLDIPGHLN